MTPRNPEAVNHEARLNKGALMTLNGFLGVDMILSVLVTGVSAHEDYGGDTVTNCSDRYLAHINQSWHTKSALANTLSTPALCVGPKTQRRRPAPVGGFSIARKGFRGLGFRVGMWGFPKIGDPDIVPYIAGSLL